MTAAMGHPALGDTPLATVQDKPLHPFFTAMMAGFAASGRPGLSDGSPEDARALVASGRAALGPPPAGQSIRELTIPTRSGCVPGLLITPAAPPCGLVVYVHGGGWMAGSCADYAVCAGRLAEASGCAVLLPDYRLAPEHPFPAGLEDCEDTLRFAAREMVALSGRPVPIAVCGDSAGANLATVALRRLGTEVEAILQVLVYPVADCDFETASYRAHATGLPLTRRDMIWFFEHYAPAERWADENVSPLRAADLAGLPSTLVVTAAFDVLRDEGAAYADRLAAAGVPVVCREAAGMTHGFIRLHNLLPEADAELADIGATIARACLNAEETRL